MEEKIEELYNRSLRKMSNALKEIESMITAFNTNIDAVHFLKSDELERVISQSNTEELMNKLRKPANKIVRNEDFLAGLLLSMKSGEGMEWIIERGDVVDWIQENLPADEYRMGGFAGITANALARLGVKTVYPHVPSLPELQAELFIERERIRIPSEADGGLCFKNPLEAARKGDEPLIHWIFEYRKGTEVKVGEKRIIAPQPNRFIATWDEKNTRLYVDEAFAKGVRKIIGKVDLALISGYHMMVESERFSREEYLERIRLTKRLLSEWKRASDVKIHLELAFFTDLNVLKATLTHLNGIIDGMGLNESELAQCVSLFSDENFSRENSEALKIKAHLKGLLLIAKKINLKKVVLHTKDFCIAISRKPVEKDLSEAMAAGNCVAMAKAITGRFCNLNEIEEIVRGRNTSLSGEGLRRFRAFKRELKREGCQPLGDFSFDMNDYVLWFMPMKITEKPLSTVGLGDCFTAGFSLLAY
ncbi:MAG TPA: hypothetical protein ENH03_01940 [Candidatus Bathyarchaeota archaeon]|nr:hypothetical protein [Candidatus Bathyarchaeota archaeon]